LTTGALGEVTRLRITSCWHHHFLFIFLLADGFATQTKT